MGHFLLFFYETALFPASQSLFQKIIKNVYPFVTLSLFPLLLCVSFYSSNSIWEVCEKDLRPKKIFKGECLSHQLETEIFCQP